MEEAGFLLAQLSPEMRLVWPYRNHCSYKAGLAGWSQVAFPCWDFCRVSWPLPGSGY